MVRLARSNASQGFGLIGIILVVAIIGLLGGGGLYVREIQNQKTIQQVGIEKVKEMQSLKQKIEEKNQALQKEMGTGDLIETNWKTYRNEKYGFEVRYPRDLTVSVKEDRNGTGLGIYDAKYSAPPGAMGVELRVEIRKLYIDISPFLQRHL